MTDATERVNDLPGLPPQPTARYGLAIVRLTLGVMFVWVFFENLGKGLYTANGYAGLINYYIQHDHAPAIWKSIMGVIASHASIGAPMQGLTEISLGVLLLLGLFNRPVAFVAFMLLGSLWLSEFCSGLVYNDTPLALISAAGRRPISVT